MSGIYSMTGGPSYTGASRQDLFDSAMSQPLSLTSTLLDQAKGGILESFGLGTAIKDLTTPQGDEAPSLAEPAFGMAAIPIPGAYTLLKSGVQALTDQGQPLTEDAYKSSASYRKDIPWDQGMTDTRAAALAASEDAKKVREYYATKRPIWSFVGKLAGGAMDPVNYIPVFDEAVAAAAVWKFGKVAGRVLVGGADAAANTGIAGLVTSDERAKFGDDVSWAALTSQMGMAALVGAAAGALHGIFGRAPMDPRLLAEAETRLSTLRAVQESRIALNEGIDAVAHGEDIRLSPNSTEPMARVANEIQPSVPKVDGGIEPPVPEGFVRIYHSGSVGEGQTGRWVSTNRKYAADYRGDLPLHYLDIPANDPRINNADIPEQGIKEGFTFNFETTPQEAAQLKEISRVQPPADLLSSGAPKAAEAKTIPSDSSLNRTASWVLRNKETKAAVMETFDPKVVDHLNTDKYEAVPIGQYLGEINGRPKPTPAIDTTAARPDAPPEGIKQAEASIAKPEDTKNLAEQYRVDPKTGTFPEEADLHQLSAEGRFTEHDAATMAQAQADYETGSAFAEALKSVAGCLI